MKDNSNSHVPWAVLYTAADLLVVTFLIAYVGLVSTAEILYPLVITDAGQRTLRATPNSNLPSATPSKSSLR